MKKTVLDPQVAGFIDGESDFFDADADTSDGPDAFDNFLEKAALAGSIGGPTQAVAYARVERFEEETANVNARAAKIMGHPEPAAIAKAAPPDEWEKDIGEPDLELAKAATTSGRARRLLSLRRWVQSCLARGESVSDLVKHAQQYDADEAAAIAEAARGLE